MGSKEKVLLDIPNDDRISDLQDDILTHILSFLPTKYSVRTRVLSTRWKQLFTLVPVLDFTLFHHECDEDCGEDCNIARSFIEFVSWVFNSYHVDKMDTFCYFASVALSESSKMHSWISESLRRGVRELDVSVLSDHPQKLPCDVFTCKTLTVMKIDGDFNVEVPDDVCLPRVKTIHLVSDKRVDVCSASRLFQSCPVLEDLYICLESKDNQVLNISIPTLKSLKIDVLGSFELVLDVPNVEYVELDGDLANKFSAVQGFKLLNEASIKVCYFSFDGFEVIEKIVSMICHVRQLCFSDNILKEFQTRGRSPPTFHNMVHLEIRGFFPRTLFSELLIGFLDRTPLLEELFVFNAWNEDDETNEQGRLLPENVPACVSLHLKQVEYCASLMDYECKLVEYLLKNGKVLESVKVQSRDKFGKHLEFSEKLQAFPRYSKACQVEFKLI